MALNSKQQKKFRRWQNETEKKTEMIVESIVFQYFGVFCFALLWDRIASSLHLRHNADLGFGQVIVCLICLVQMIRWWRVTR